MAGLGLQGSKISRIEPESCGAKGASHEVAANGQGCPE
jgi:hypothetical protein